MFINAIFSRTPISMKLGSNYESVLKNFIQKFINRRTAGFQTWSKNSSLHWFSRQRISVNKFKKEVNNFGTIPEPSTVLNNVIIYKYEKEKVFKFLQIFGFIQLYGMYSMVVNIYKTFCQDLFDCAPDWKTRVSKHPFSLITIFCGCFFGPILTLAIIGFSARTIRRIILHKGGEKVTIITYHLLPQMRSQTVELKKVSSVAKRQFRNTLPIKIQGKSFYYFCDSEAVFPNPELYDFTVGVNRRNIWNASV